MVYDPGALNASLAAAVGSDTELLAELRAAFLESAERQADRHRPSQGLLAETRPVTAALRPDRREALLDRGTSPRLDGGVPQRGDRPPQRFQLRC